jgi:predicted DNA binding CopG/RHH family protein
MRQHYDLAKMKGAKNPFAKHLKKQISIRIGIDTLEYFKNLSEETGIPYQNLIDSYLADCAEKHLKLHMKWG